ncbi:MAG: ATPase domain-containing protein [Candidatus Thermoplasmatota archaeon]
MSAKPRREDEREALCPVCGNALAPDSRECGRCGSPRVSKGTKVPLKKARKARDEHHRLLRSLGNVPGLMEEHAKSLIEAGFTDMDSLAAASEEELSSVPGIGTEMAKAIKRALGNPSRSQSQEDEALAKWLRGEEDEKALSTWLGDKKGKPKVVRRVSASKAEGMDEGADALKRWLMGEEDTLQNWLGAPPAPKAPSAPVGVGGEQLLEKEQMLMEREAAIKEKEEELNAMGAELETMKRTIEAELGKIQTGDFNPMVLIEETARLNRDLQAEIRKRKELEEEVAQVKKGSIAVIKYVKAQQLHAKDDTARAIKKRLDEVSAENERHKIEMKKLEELNARLGKEIAEGLKTLPEDAKLLKERELALMQREKEIEALKAGLEAKEKALKDASAPSAPTGPEAAELQQRLISELAEKEKEFIEREGDLKKQLLGYEEQIQELKIQLKQMEESIELKGKGKAEIDEELARKERDLQIKEKSMLLREEEIRRLKDQLKEKEEEIKKIREPIRFKEEEQLRREEDLLHRERLLMEERRRFEEAKKESGGSIEAHEYKLKLEELKAEVARKEDQLRAREQYLNQKAEDLRLREQGIIEEEIEAREEDRALELQVEKVRTGTSRLDDLLLGGVPFGQNVLIYGAPFTGKEIIINSFISEGLKKGVPVIWVITDKLPSEIREEMMFILSGYEEYERLGLVKYVDAYSKSLGEVSEDPNVLYLDEPTDFAGILKAVDTVSKELLKKHKYYRLGFRSISTLIAYLDSATAFKHLQPFVGRRKRERSVAMYAIEKGMHTEQDIQMIGSIMDGSIEFKTEQLKTYLCVKGIGNVQSRAWVEYTYSKQGIIMGSFTLEHIR